MKSRIAFILCSFACSGAVLAEGTTPQPASQPDADELYQMGKQLFDQYAPPEVKEQYDFPDKGQFNAFLAKLQDVLNNGSIEELAGYENQAKQALILLRTLPEYAGYADWLQARIEEMDAARQIAALPKAPSQIPPRVAPGPPGVGPAILDIPYYAFWMQRMKSRPAPSNAPELMPRLRRAFVQEGVPPEIAWIAEVESSLNPNARSPVGAKGLFQFKAETAKEMGLSTFLPDERTDPDKSARAAARMLKALRLKFGSWPLAFAAYNAGPGRVERTLAARHARDFAGIADSLPAETRMYVPEVCAVVAARTGIPPERIAPPT